GFFHGGLFSRRRRSSGGFSRGGGAVGFALGALFPTFLCLYPRLRLLWGVAALPLDDADLAELARDAVGRLGALVEPLLDALGLQDDAVRVVLLQQRVVADHLFDEM